MHQIYLQDICGSPRTQSLEFTLVSVAVAAPASAPAADDDGDDDDKDDYDDDDVDDNDDADNDDKDSMCCAIWLTTMGCFSRLF